MTTPPPMPPLARRRLLLGMAAAPAAALVASARRAAAAPSAAPDTAGVKSPAAQAMTLLVGGPEHGALDGWADLLAPPLAQILGVPALHREAVGGMDGVTAANQFEARPPAEGQAALLLPGSAAMAWLVGDPRAKFDIGHWLPVMAGLSETVLVGRPAFAGLPSRRKLRLAAAGPAGAELPALLALDILNVDVQPVFGLTGADAARQAFLAGKVDALVVHGAGTADMAGHLPGAVPLLSLAPADDGLAREGQALSLPTVASLHHARSASAAPLMPAWRVAARTAMLDMALVLPHLTSASSVALWRHAADVAVEDPAVKARADAQAIRLVTGPDSSAAMTTLAAPTPVQLTLRRWLLSRYNWRPA